MFFFGGLLARKHGGDLFQFAKSQVVDVHSFFQKMPIWAG
jgi:hypothetical protein